VATAVAATEDRSLSRITWRIDGGLGPGREFVDEEPSVGVEASVIESGQVLGGPQIAEARIERRRVRSHDGDGRADLVDDRCVEAPKIRRDHVAVRRVDHRARPVGHVRRWSIHRDLSGLAKRLAFESVLERRAAELLVGTKLGW